MAAATAFLLPCDSTCSARPSATPPCIAGASFMAAKRALASLAMAR
jgi:hypothetical protein